jgi:SAM-dependent methyltransferase
MTEVASTSEFWSQNQPGFRFTDERPGTPAFYQAVERHRYTLEPHILEVVPFDAWRDRDVLEIGCGVATDGIRFARGGARYTGVDQTDAALALARRRFELEERDGRFERASALELPFPDASFDLVYSHGVLHHVPDTEGAIAELRRVLRPGGVALLMLYHRTSLNYHVTIMGLRRTLATLLMADAGTAAVAALTGESRDVLDGHRALLREHGLRYLTNRQLFLSNNTDGPGNPLSKVYSRTEAKELLRNFDDVATTVRYLNTRIYPMGDRLAGSRAGRALERRIGWHLYVTGRKPAPRTV